MKKSFNLEAETITYTFDGLPPVIAYLSEMSDEVLTYAQYHGLAASITDTAAIAIKRPDDTSVPVTEAMRRNNVEARVAFLHSGTKDWTSRAARAPAQSPTIAAIATKLGCTYAEAEAKVAEQMLGELAA